MTKKSLPKPYGYREISWPYFPGLDGKFWCNNCNKVELSTYGVCSKECKIALEKKEKRNAQAEKKREEKRKARKVSDLTVGELEEMLRGISYQD